MTTFAQRNAPVLDVHNYPKTWNEYVGQDNAKKMLQLAAKSAKMRKAPLDHVLIAHQTPGIGKTALAVLTAREMGRPVRLVQGAIAQPEARLILADMKDRDVIFWDEFHQAMDGGRKNAEWLLTYLQDGLLAGPFGPEKQPRVTIIAATTDPQKLPPAIVSRFIQPFLTEYDVEEAAKIAQVTSKKVLVPEGLPRLSLPQGRTVATAANRNPRAIEKLLSVLRDLTITGELKVTKGEYDLVGLLAFQGLTEDGLDEIARRYLATLVHEFKGKAGIRALADRISAPAGLAATEKVLLDRGYIARTGTGRELTRAGIDRFRELEAAA